MPLVVDGLCLGSFHVLMLWPTLSGVHRACRGQTWSGGILLGLAVWLKLNRSFLGRGLSVVAAKDGRRRAGRRFRRDA